MMMLIEECNTILQKKLPLKLKYPEIFNISCTIGSSYYAKSLCDLGASVNLMSFSVSKKLGLGQPKVTTVSLQFIDRSIKCRREIIEDVLVKIIKFISLADFIVLDMEDDDEIF